MGKTVFVKCELTTKNKRKHTLTMSHIKLTTIENQCDLHSMRVAKRMMRLFNRINESKKKMKKKRM